MFQGKEIKRASLNEVVDYVNTSNGILSETVYFHIVKMVMNFRKRIWLFLNQKCSVQ